MHFIASEARLDTFPRRLRGRLGYTQAIVCPDYIDHSDTKYNKNYLKPHNQILDTMIAPGIHSYRYYCPLPRRVNHPHLFVTYRAYE
jgi:hypothetical protein